MPGNGSAQLRELSAKLKAEANGGLKLKLVRNLRAGAQPLVPAVKQAAMRQLPKSGGLNRQVAGQKVTVSVSTSARTAGVRLRTTAPDTAMTDSGFVRHPTFGRRSKGEWRTQQIPQAAGWWSKTLAYKAPQVTPFLMKAIQETADELRV